jgi:hypothetical protein
MQLGGGANAILPGPGSSCNSKSFPEGSLGTYLREPITLGRPGVPAAPWLSGSWDANSSGDDSSGSDD